MKLNLSIVIVLLCLIGAYFRYTHSAEQWTPATFPRSIVNLKIEPLQDLNGKNRADLAALRLASLQREPALKGLVPAGYAMGNRPAFDSLQDGPNWEGAEGIYTGTARTQTAVFARGPSLESAVILNPFLLVSLRPHYGLFGCAESGLDRWTSSQLPTHLDFDGIQRTLSIVYVHHGRLPEYRVGQGPVYNLNLINARDLGLQRFAVLSQGTRGFEGIHALQGHTFDFDKVYPLSQHYGVDPVPNSSARLANLFYDSEVVVLKNLPAQLHLVLWRSADAKSGDVPDISADVTVTNDDPRCLGDPRTF